MTTRSWNAESEQRRQLEAVRAGSKFPELWALLDQVSDPEIPALSIWDMGVLRDIVRYGDKVTVIVSPTYSGCPAMAHIEAEIGQVLHRAGIAEWDIRTELSPAWGSGCMSSKGMENLRSLGIAPPVDGGTAEDGLTPSRGVRCPRCGSRESELISEFGSTACKALFRCLDCLEPFDYFKRL